jgi:hypothetical protein
MSRRASLKNIAGYHDDLQAPPLPGLIARVGKGKHMQIILGAQAGQTQRA